MRFACLFVPDFPIEAVLRVEPGLRGHPVAITSGPRDSTSGRPDESRSMIEAASPEACERGVCAGLTQIQALARCPALVCRPRDSSVLAKASADPRASPVPAESSADDSRGREAGAQDALLDVAQSFSPRVENAGPGLVVLDIEGLSRVFGDAEEAIARGLKERAEALGLRARVAIASTRVAAMLAVQVSAGSLVVPPGEEWWLLASLPIGALDLVRGSSADNSRTTSGSSRRMSGLVKSSADPRKSSTDPRASSADPRKSSAGLQASSVDPQKSSADDLRGQTFERWGIRTLGDLAALPDKALSARLGQEGLRLQHLARGLDDRPLIPYELPPCFAESITLEWAIDTLEPLAFVLARLLERVCARLEARGMAADALRLMLRLTDRTAHVRDLRLASPLRDPRVLLRLVRMDLERHPPPAAVEVLSIEARPSAARILQFSLLEPAVPSPEALATTLARLTELVGDRKAGAPVLVDTHRPDAFELREFAVGATARGPSAAWPEAARRENRLRREAMRREDHPQAEVTSRENHLPPESRPRTISGGEQGRRLAFRMLRPPVPVEVQAREGRMIEVRAGRWGGRVLASAGPWRSSGGWWAQDGWARDEWDVALSDGGLYRIYCQLADQRWFLEGMYD